MSDDPFEQFVDEYEYMSPLEKYTLYKRIFTECSDIDCWYNFEDFCTEGLDLADKFISGFQREENIDIGLDLLNGLASSVGCAESAVILARMYTDGVHVPKNLNRAAQYLEMVEDCDPMDVPDYGYLVGQFHENGWGGWEIDYDEARESYAYAARELNDIDCMIQILNMTTNDKIEYEDDCEDFCGYILENGTDEDKELVDKFLKMFPMREELTSDGILLKSL